MNILEKVWRRARSLLPVQGFVFDRPLLLLQSDDWGRIGLRDQDGLAQLKAAGLSLGDRPYDFYTLETAQDLASLSQLLKRHRDASGRPACLGMNFVTANLDFAKMAAEDFQRIQLRALSDGLPDGWQRPGLFGAYHEGIDAGVFYPALHGLTHFCRQALEREISAQGERGSLVKTLWKAGTPYVHWRMPWIGYEYWDPEQPSEQFLSSEAQVGVIGTAVGNFARMFSTLPRSACAPGYRANEDTHKTWAHFGVRVAQNGPGTSLPPHLDRYGLLHLYRTLDFEPGIDDDFSVSKCLDLVSESFRNNQPAIVSIHAINFHSTVMDFRTKTLAMLDEFLSAVEAKFPNLLYLHDGDLYDLTQSGTYASASTGAPVGISRRAFTARNAPR
jgi:hypothetical protein